MHKNILLRVLWGLFFIPALILIAYEGRFYFLILTELGIGIGVYEFYKILEARGLKPYKFLGTLAALLIGWTAYYTSYFFTFLVLTSLILILSVSELTRKTAEGAIFHMSTTVFGIFYVAWLMSHLVQLRELPRFLHLNYKLGMGYALLPFLIAWTNDTFAFIGGVCYGKHKLIPRISPGKTWEGTITGLIFTVVATFLFKEYCASYLSIFDCVILSVVGSILGLIGDLVESLLKRDVDIKDTSGAIPGHGGVLDRFDSVLFVAPFVYYYLRSFVLK